jgi:hypothetical protein
MLMFLKASILVLLFGKRDAGIMLNHLIKVKREKVRKLKLRRNWIKHQNSSFRR